MRVAKKNKKRGKTIHGIPLGDGTEGQDERATALGQNIEKHLAQGEGGLTPDPDDFVGGRTVVGGNTTKANIVDATWDAYQRKNEKKRHSKGPMNRKPNDAPPTEPTLE